MISYEALKTKTESAARWAVVALGVSIPVSTALDGILTGVVVALWLISRTYAHHFKTVLDNAVVMPVLLVVGLYCLGMFYSAGNLREIWDSLLGGIRLLLIPVMIPMFLDPVVRNRAITGFLLTSMVILALSFGIWTGWMPPLKILKGYPLDPVVFKYHITHNFLMAFAAFFFALEARYAVQQKRRVIGIVGFALSAFNVFVMVPGRTGQLMLIVLLLYLLFCWAGRVWKMAGVIAVVCVLVVASLIPSSAFYRGVKDVVQEYKTWIPGEARGTSSVQLRLDWYLNSLSIIRESPVYGVGTGGFARAFAARALTPGAVRTDNPHNEYLAIATQFGLVGLGVWLFLFFRQWVAATCIPSPRERMMAQGLVVSILTASLVSSTLMDHTEGLFFAWLNALCFAALPPRRPGGIAKHESFGDRNHEERGKQHS